MDVQRLKVFLTIGILYVLLMEKALAFRKWLSPSTYETVTKFVHFHCEENLRRLQRDVKALCNVRQRRLFAFLS